MSFAFSFRLITKARYWRIISSLFALDYAEIINIRCAMLEALRERQSVPSLPGGDATFPVIFKSLFNIIVVST